MIKSPISWVGGKFYLRKQIIERIPEHKCYVEVFGGAGWVLFAKPAVKSDVYNDLHGALVNFFRVVKHRPAEFVERFKWLLPSRELYEVWYDSHEEPFDEVERAARFFYKLRLSFGSSDITHSFARKTTGKVNLDIGKLSEILEPVHKRLARVAIEQMDYVDLLDVYDRRHTFFFCDPPYYLPEGLYKHSFEPEDFQRFRDKICSIEGKFLITLNDHPEVRQLFKGFKIEEYQIRYTLSRSPKRKQKGDEIFISNY